MDDNKTVQIPVQRHLWRDERNRIIQRRNKRIGTFMIATVVFLAGWFSHVLVGGVNKKNDELERFNNMLDVMSRQWYYSSEYEDIRQELIDKAMRGMATSDFDPHTQYFSIEELESFQQGIDQTYIGIGVEMNMATEYPLIMRVFYDSPAEKNGLEVGDYIIAVDDVDIKGMSFEEVRPMVLGEVGSFVKITYRRDGKNYEKVMARETISNTIFTNIISKDLAYMQISTFGSGTANEFKRSLNELEEKNIKQLIIDLRDNGGGYLDVLLKMADCFLEKNEVIFKQVYVDKNELVHKASTSTVYRFDKIIILINGNTASASEVFASCMQDHGLATLVGDKTFGKGTAQTVHPFSNGSALKYTQTHWYSANGKQINGIGVSPDVAVSLPKFVEMEIPEVEADTMIKYDSVNGIVAYVQAGLRFMGYSLDREDGYFSAATLKAVQSFQADNGLKQTDYIDSEFFMRFMAVARQYYSENRVKLDSQYAKAVELAS